MTPTSEYVRDFEWVGPSSDPNDEQFGDAVEPVTLDALRESGSDADREFGPRFVLVGEPYDGAVIGRPGAAEGPGAIRETLASLKTHHFAAGPVSGLRDLGDLVIPDADTVAVQDAVADATREVHGMDATPVFLGGDNSLSYPNALPLVEAGPTAVVSFDAHLDCREPSPEPTSGTPYHQLFEAGLEDLVVVGARDFETSTAYAAYLDARDGSVVTAEAVGRDLDAALDRIIDSLAGVDTLYLSVDADVLDAAAAPGVSAPTPGGLQARELFRLVRHLAGDSRVAGLEVVECAPPLDRESLTSKTCARTVAHFLAGVGGNHE